MKIIKKENGSQPHWLWEMQMKTVKEHFICSTQTNISRSCQNQLWTKIVKTEYQYTTSERKNRYIHFKILELIRHIYTIDQGFQPWQYRHFEPDNSVVWGAVLQYGMMFSIIHGLHLHASYTHSPPNTPHLQLWKPLLFSDNIKCPLGRKIKITPTENHWPRLCQFFQ